MKSLFLSEFMILWLKIKTIGKSTNSKGKTNIPAVLTNTEKTKNIDPAQSATLALYARYLKRISAHSRNLISSIVNPFERIGYPE